MGGLAAAGLIALLGIASRVDLPVQAWVLVLTLVAVSVTSFALGRRLGRADDEDLPGYHADHLRQALLTLREMRAGRLPTVSFGDFIEQGILAPARYGLTVERGEEIRLSILECGASKTFRMTYESGHTLGRKQDFELGMSSLAGHAYQTGNLQWTNDVDGDSRWTPHPKADLARSYKSLVSMPIVVSDEVVAVLNVLSTRGGAFLKGDLTYIQLLGALLGLTWTLRATAEPASTLSES